jgi:hypothetical protein
MTAVRRRLCRQMKLENALLRRYCFARKGMNKKKQLEQATFEGDTDKRIIEKMLREKTLAVGDLKHYIDSIPDVSDNAEEFVVELGRRP